MPRPRQEPKISPKNQYFLVVFAVVYLLTFAVFHFGDGMSRRHPGVPVGNLSAGKSALVALFVALPTAFFTAKRKFD
jgi:hypothetical protein